MRATLARRASDLLGCLTAIDPDADYSGEPTTLVTFTLEAVDGGTRLTIVESGFDAIPEARRAKAFGMNTGGWNGQADNLRKYLWPSTWPVVD